MDNTSGVVSSLVSSWTISSTCNLQFPFSFTMTRTSFLLRTHVQEFCHCNILSACKSFNLHILPACSKLVEPSCTLLLKFTREWNVYGVKHRISSQPDVKAPQSDTTTVKGRKRSEESKFQDDSDSPTPSSFHSLCLLPLCT